MKKLFFLALILAFQLGASAQTRSWNAYGKTFNVKGGAGIEQFVTAIFNIKPNEWDGEPVFDKRCGYFSYFQEGGGSVTYNVSYWNRKDGKKLVILSYRDNNFGNKENPQSSAWGYYGSFQYGMADTDILNTETGCRAYLYDEAKKQLVPMATPPFNGLPNPMDSHYFLQLPREGKDIIVCEQTGMYDHVYHSLKWNGMTFDFKKEGNVLASFFLTDSKANIRTAPNGKVVKTLPGNGSHVVDILKIENGWCLIYGNVINEYEESKEVELKGSATGQYWIHTSCLGANGTGEAKLHATPEEGSKVLMDLTEDTLVVPIEMRGEWVKVREVKSKKEGWVLSEDLCSNPLTTCA